MENIFLYTELNILTCYQGSQWSIFADFTTNICWGWSWQMGYLASKQGNCLNGLWSPILVYFPVPVNFLCACLLFAHSNKNDGYKEGVPLDCFNVFIPCHVSSSGTEARSELTQQELSSVSASPGASLQSPWATKALKVGFQAFKSGLKQSFKAVLCFPACCRTKVVLCEIPTLKKQLLQVLYWNKVKRFPCFSRRARLEVGSIWGDVFFLH